LCRLYNEARAALGPAEGGKGRAIHDKTDKCTPSWNKTKSKHGLHEHAPWRAPSDVLAWARWWAET